MRECKGLGAPLKISIIWTPVVRYIIQQGHYNLQWQEPSGPSIWACTAAKRSGISLKFYCFLMIFSCFIRHLSLWICPLTDVAVIVCWWTLMVPAMGGLKIEGPFHLPVQWTLFKTTQKNMVLLVLKWKDIHIENVDGVPESCWVSSSISKRWWCCTCIGQWSLWFKTL